jgi:hypothetical protein
MPGYRPGMMPFMMNLPIALMGAIAASCVRFGFQFIDKT